MRLTLPTRTALLTTSLVLLLVGATGAWQYRGLSERYVDLLGAQQQGFAQLAAADIDYKMASLLDTLTREARDVDAETFSNPQARTAFMQRGGLRPTFDGVGLIARDGSIVANDPPTPGVLSVADRDYFQRARDLGQPAISQPLKARTTGQSAVILAVPVKDAAGQVIGVLAGGLDLNRSNVLSDLAQTRVGKQGYYLIESGGARPVYVVHPDGKLVLAAARPIDSDSVSASAPVPTTGWTLRVVLPGAAAYGPLDLARKALLWQMLVLGLVCGVLVWAGTVFMLRPFGQLHRAIRALRQSPDLAVTLDARNDERGDLAREFDALISELRTKRSEMAAVMDASPLGLFRCDADGLMVYVNDAYLSIHGLVRSESDRGWLSLVPEVAREEVWADWQQRVRDDKPFQVIRWLHRREGGDVRVSLQMRPVMVDGRVAGQVGTVSDITLRMRAEQALRTLTAIFESTTDFVVQLDKHGKLTYMNPAARAVTGLPQDASILHLTMADFNPPRALQRLMYEVVPTAVAKGVWVGESTIWDAHKNEFPVSHMVIAHRDKHGKIERFSAVMRDISLAKGTEQALSESEARLRTMADALPMRVAYIDTDGRYLFANRAYEGFFGMSRKQIEGSTVQAVFGAERYAEIEPHVRAAQAGKRVTFESAMATATDSLYFQSSYIPQRSVDGESVIGFHAVTIDITEQRREEDRLVQIARQDPLTGLGNRSAFERRLADAMRHSQENGSPMALMYIDLDRFKSVNDRFGHPCGDALLKAVAERLSAATRTSDFVSRLGGDEFTVILQELRQDEDAVQVARKILAAMKEPFRLDALTLDISASVGVACYAGAPATAEQLIRRADEMLYQAKGAGRDNFQVALAAGGVEMGT